MELGSNQSKNMEIMLNANVWGQLLFPVLTSGHPKDAQLASLYNIDNQIYINKSIENVPTWRQKDTELLTKKVWHLSCILAMASEPIKLSELMAAIDYKNQKTFSDNYLSPLRRVGFIEFTNPEKPIDPENKYRITEAGKLFLGGMI
jgi:ATP-dependent DNA helicase RecG